MRQENGVGDVLNFLFDHDLWTTHSLRALGSTRFAFHSEFIFDFAQWKPRDIWGLLVDVVGCALLKSQLDVLSWLDEECLVQIDAGLI